MLGKMVSHYHTRGAIALAAVVLILLVAVALRRHVFVRATKPTGPHIVRIANSPGMQFFSSRFSPDGNRVAFSSFGDACCNLDIYVKQIGVDKTLRLTTDPAKDESPVWSPDGRYIAFWRHGEGEHTIYVVPSMGGPERKLLTSSGHFADDASMDWALNGKYLVYVGNEPNERIFLLTVDNPKDNRPLTTSPGLQAAGYLPRFSPDGQKVAFVRYAETRDICVAPTSGGEAKRLTFDDAFIYGLDWTSDGTYIVFVSDREGAKPRLWRVSASGGQPEPMSLVTDIEGEFALSHDGRRLAYTKWEWNSNLWRYEVLHRANESAPPTKLIASEGYNGSPRFSPDGKSVAFLSSRSGSSQIWVCSSDGSNPRQLTYFEARSACCPRWSPDGRAITFQVPFATDGTDIYVVNAEGGQPRRLETGPSRVAAPSWSRDGKWIYFGSNRSGAWQVWKVPSSGGRAVQVTKKGGTGGLESPDGKAFYYAKGRSARGLWKVATSGGDEAQVLPQPRASLFDVWGVARDGIYFFNDETDAVELYSFSTRQITRLAKPEKRGGDVALSPDGRWVLFGQVDADVSHLVLADELH